MIIPQVFHLINVLTVWSIQHHIMLTTHKHSTLFNSTLQILNIMMKFTMPLNIIVDTFTCIVNGPKKEFHTSQHTMWSFNGASQSLRNLQHYLLEKLTKHAQWRNLVALNQWAELVIRIGERGNAGGSLECPGSSLNTSTEVTNGLISEGQSY